MKKKSDKKRVDAKKFLKKNYSMSFGFIKESKNFIYIGFSIFLFFTLIGFFIPAPPEITEQILELIEELLKKTEGLSHYGLIEFIFLNNLQASFFAMVFGVLLGIFPIFTLISNGYLLGFVAAFSVDAGGILVLWRLLPHGIFELPAIFISTGLGLKIGSFVFQKKKIESFKIYMEKSFITFLLVVLPLLIIAAIIEGTLIAFSN